MQYYDLNDRYFHMRIVSCTSPELQAEVVDPLSHMAEVHNCASFSELEKYLAQQSIITLPEIMLLEVDETGAAIDFIKKIKDSLMLKGLIIVFLSRKQNAEWLAEAKQLKINDYYTAPFDVAHITERLKFLVKFKLVKNDLSKIFEDEDSPIKVPWSKRLFDIAFSGLLLLMISPLLLLVALLIRLESKGPIIYRSKRVGTGYKIFDFYKFRSMYPDADKKLAALAASHNQYVGDGVESETKSTFVKLKNDPRVTKVGRIIRKTSIDELPQLFNILKGDMSTVGNRPLPLYEAEMLTADEWSWRFLAPAGLTGLWQISRRGREEMSERERMKLDTFYAKKYSLYLDMKILARTLPAALQKENV